MAARKFIDFKGQEKEVQKYANNNFDGNFTSAVNHLIELALKSEQLAEGKKKQS